MSELSRRRWIRRNLIGKCSRADRWEVWTVGPGGLAEAARCPGPLRAIRAAGRRQPVTRASGPAASPDACKRRERAWIRGSSSDGTRGVAPPGGWAAWSPSRPAASGSRRRRRVRRRTRPPRARPSTATDRPGRPGSASIPGRRAVPSGAWRRRANERSRRAAEALHQALGPALDAITAQDAGGFFRRAGCRTVQSNMRYALTLLCHVLADRSFVSRRCSPWRT